MYQKQLGSQGNNDNNFYYSTIMRHFKMSGKNNMQNKKPLSTVVDRLVSLQRNEYGQKVGQQSGRTERAILLLVYVDYAYLY